MSANENYSRYLLDDAVARDQLNILLKPETIRTRCALFLDAARQSNLIYFKVNDKNMAECVAFISEVTKRNYPNLTIPYHSRWRNVEQYSSDFLKENVRRESDDLRFCRAALDFIFVSVLIDSGAGGNWKYIDKVSGDSFTRSEGLGLSSLRMFESGIFSANPEDHWRVDAITLQTLDEKILLAGMQVTADNHLDGFESRLEILRNLGDALEHIAKGGGMRPSDLVLDLVQHNSLDLTQVLEALLRVLAPIWPLGTKISGRHYGDVGEHSLLNTTDIATGKVPIHKLSQWLTYSLIEPLENAGIHVFGIENLTGLGEYRNGGLLIDIGVLELKDPKFRTTVAEPTSELVVEWRALTIAILDELVPQVARKLELPEEHFSLLMLLQGGSWSAGRLLAYRRNNNGDPPIKLKNTGAVF